VTEPDETADMPLGARIHRLQRIVADLEREDVELEVALRLFEEGVGHLRAAEALVARTELRVERLLEDGSLAVDPAAASAADDADGAGGADGADGADGGGAAAEGTTGPP
jgi:exodeoxyribonuclease VII small subunit